MPGQKILLGLTTTSNSDWKEKIAECKKFNIQEIALFLTGIGLAKRQELYALLENSPVKNIPHVHLRNDMKIEELDYLTQKFQTKVFNIHSNKDVHKYTEDYGKYLPGIYVENTVSVPEADELMKYGGLCIDFSHWQNALLCENKKYVFEMEKVVRKFEIGCSHISAIDSVPQKTPDQKLPEIIYEGYDKHMLANLKELDYVKNFIKYLPELISLELENPFAKQLKTKKYLEELLTIN